MPSHPNNAGHTAQSGNDDTGIALPADSIGSLLTPKDLGRALGNGPLDADGPRSLRADD